MPPVMGLSGGAARLGVRAVWWRLPGGERWESGQVVAVEQIFTDGWELWAGLVSFALLLLTTRPFSWSVVLKPDSLCAVQALFFSAAASRIRSSRWIISSSWFFPANTFRASSMRSLLPLPEVTTWTVAGETPII